MLRLFIAIELPPEVHEVIGAAQSRLAPRHVPVRWVDPAGAHLTLKFLGSTPPERVGVIETVLKEVAYRNAPFFLKTASFGVFPSTKAPRVVWLGITGDVGALSALQADVEQFVAPLGYPSEARAFNAHLTLGRTIKSARPADVAQLGQLVGTTPAPALARWRVSSLSLMLSELGSGGPRYTCLRAIELDTKGDAAIIPSIDDTSSPPPEP